MNPAGNLLAMLRLDLDAWRRAWWFAPVVVLMGAVITWNGDEPLVPNILPYVTLVATLLPLILWGRDRTERLDRLYGALPVRRRDLVAARYLEVVLLQAAAWLLLVLLAAVSHVASATGGVAAQVQAAGFTVAALTAVWAVTFPLLVRFRGATWALAPGFLLTAAIAAAAATVLGAVRPDALAVVVGAGAGHGAAPVVGACLVALALLAASYPLSVHIREGLDL